MKIILTGFANYVRIHRNRNLLFIVACFTAISVLFAYVFEKIYVSVLQQETLQRKQLAARSGANAIETFIDLIGMHTYHLALEASETSSKKETTAALENYLATFKDYPIKGVVLTDKEGVVKYVTNPVNTNYTGVSLADRNYFKSLKADLTQSYIISTPVTSKLGATAGESILVVASPIVKDGEFSGIVASSILLSELTNKYFEPLKLKKDTQVNLVNSEGIVLSSTDSSQVGKNYIDELKYAGPIYFYKDLNTQKVSMDTKVENKLDVYLSSSANTGDGARYLVASAPLKHNKGEYWSVVISSPVENAFDYRFLFERYSLAVLVYLIFVIMFLSFYNIMENKMIRKLAYKEGLRRGKT